MTGRDDLLDPTSGFRLGGRLSPEVSLQGGTFTYARAQIDASAYRSISAARGRGRAHSRLVRSSARAVTTLRRRDVSIRAAAGSVRGYGYQRLGPRDIDGDPIGGRSLAEFALEARMRLKAFGGNFGIVPFFDGGTLADSSMPSMKNWQFGAGIGLRYYSSFGPIRLDVGTPLNPRSKDGPIAVTVSLGQAF